MRRKEAVVQMLHVKHPSRTRLQHPYNAIDAFLDGAADIVHALGQRGIVRKDGRKLVCKPFERSRIEPRVVVHQPKLTVGVFVERLGREREIVRSQAFERRRAPEAAARIEQRRDTVAQRFHVSHKPEVSPMPIGVSQDVVAHDHLGQRDLDVLRIKRRAAFQVVLVIVAMVRLTHSLANIVGRDVLFGGADEIFADADGTARPALQAIFHILVRGKQP